MKLTKQQKKENLNRLKQNAIHVVSDMPFDLNEKKFWNQKV